MQSNFLLQIQSTKMFRAQDLKLNSQCSSLEAMVAFQAVAECQFSRIMEGSNGVLFLVSVPGKDNTGAIYFYDFSNKTFFWLSVGGRDEDLTSEEFDSFARLFGPTILSQPQSAATRTAKHRRRRHHRGGKTSVHPGVLAQQTIAPIASMAVN